ncbi:MdtA/MuxA family multidrug efflux RND transporter periplasmic adaptor subunit [Burkholderiaceae bacterium DAT-1]|nr:MdtA/MuxA family multidrug efflux RND transporter periplasmic adaptor subunit [Burkholderiaceae bacterium DAT-1]
MSTSTPDTSTRSNTTWIIAALLILIAGGGWWMSHRDKGGDAGPGSEQNGPGGKGGKGGNRGPQAVRAAIVKQGDLHVFLDGLGTVTPVANMLVKPRVDGLLQKVNFQEGQMVRKGEVLAEIDPAPFEATLRQQEGQLMRDEALLNNAKNDLARYRTLLEEASISRQQADTQAAVVAQYEGVVKADRALVDTARLQLSWTRVTAPAAGRTGLRQVDPGNMVRASDASGLVYISQVDPISVVFTLPEAQIPRVAESFRKGNKLSAEAWDRDRKTLLAAGTLTAVDNQVDTSTGTVKLRATFANDKGVLFPNQFVNVKLLADTRQKTILMPVAAIQRGNQGTFVYVIVADNSVSIRPVTLGPVDGDVVAVEQGVAAGDKLVIDGADKLREGAKVEVASDKPEAGARKKGEGRGDGHGKRSDAVAH